MHAERLYIGIRVRMSNNVKQNVGMINLPPARVYIQIRTLEYEASGGEPVSLYMGD